MPPLFLGMQCIYLHVCRPGGWITADVHATSNTTLYSCTSTGLIHKYATVSPTLKTSSIGRILNSKSDSINTKISIRHFRRVNRKALKIEVHHWDEIKGKWMINQKCFIVSQRRICHWLVAMGINLNIFLSVQMVTFVFAVSFWLKSQLSFHKVLKLHHVNTLL